MSKSQERAIGALAAAIALGTAIWFGSSWVDDPPDATCGSLWRTDLWLDRSSCQEPMLARGVVSLALVAAGGWVTFRVFRRINQNAVAPAIGLVGASLVVLIINEVVRSGGALSGS